MDNQITLNIRKRSTLKCIFFWIITLGWYFYIWLWKLVKDVNNLDFEQDKKLNFWVIAIVPLILDVYDTYHTMVTWNNDDIDSWDKLYIKVIGLIYLFISVVILKKIEEYSQKKYKVSIKHNPFGALFFTVLYTNFAINNFQDRVQKALNNKAT